MKKQALFSLNDKSKKLKCRLLQFSFGALRVKLVPFKTDIMQKVPYFLCSVYKRI